MKLRTMMIRVAGLTGLGLIAACSSAPPGTPGSESVSQTEQAQMDEEFTGHIMGLPGYRTPLNTPIASGTEAAPPPAAKTLTYLGGQVISNPHLVMVNWTSGTDPNVQSTIPQMLTDLVTANSYFGMLAQYSTSKQTITTSGSFVGSYTITPTTTTCTASCTLTKAAIAKELNAQINAGHLPMYTKDAAGFVDTLYIMEFPASIRLSLTTNGSTSYSCSSFCGYHEWTLHGTAKDAVPFAVMPGANTGLCHTNCVDPSIDGGNYMHDVEAVTTHEVFEAVTDTRVTISSSGYISPSAWCNETYGEIGDECAWIFGTLTVGANTWQVQQEWSNARSACSVN
jgi:hypothetical protein